MLIAKDAPGTADFAAFYRAAADSGFFSLGAGRGNPGMNEGRGIAAMYKAIADSGGIPYEQHVNVTIEGGSMQRMTPPPTVTRVSSVSTDPIPDDKFQIPAGYTRKTQ